MVSKWEQFSWNKKYFLTKKSFLNIKKIILVLRYILNSSQISCRKDKKIFLSESFFLFGEKYSDIFLIWEQISQCKKIFLNKFWSICSVKESGVEPTPIPDLNIENWVCIKKANRWDSNLCCHKLKDFEWPAPLRWFIFPLYRAASARSEKWPSEQNCT